jgi:hypothetical protein
MGLIPAMHNNGSLPPSSAMDVNTFESNNKDELIIFTAKNAS